MKKLNLYKVKAEEWSNANFAAASNQMDAIELVHKDIPDMDSGHCSVTYLGEVYVPE